MGRTGLLVAVAFAAGCHARFKKHVHLIDEVRPQVVVATGPSVVLGGSGGEGVVAAAVNIVQGVRSIQAAGRLAESVEIEGVNRAFTASLRESIGSGPPFGTSADPAASLLQATVVNYGLFSPAMGVQGTFEYTVHVEIFLPEGKKVYNNNVTCEIGFGQASALSQVLATVDNVKQLENMSDEEIQATFESAASFCGQQLVLEMRRHASSSRAVPPPAPAPFVAPVAAPPEATIITE